MADYDPIEDIRAGKVRIEVAEDRPPPPRPHRSLEEIATELGRRRHKGRARWNILRPPGRRIILSPTQDPAHRDAIEAGEARRMVE